jgi:hypothetical protein
VGCHSVPEELVVGGAGIGIDTSVVVTDGVIRQSVVGGLVEHDAGVAVVGYTVIGESGVRGVFDKDASWVVVNDVSDKCVVVRRLVMGIISIDIDAVIGAVEACVVCDGVVG